MPEKSKENTDILVVSKTGKLKKEIIETNTIIGISELTEVLSKKCGNIKSSGFSCYHTYRFRNRRCNLLRQHDKNEIPKYIYVDVWGKTDGRAGEENRYELPPPIDEILFFGNIALVSRIDAEIACNLTKERWNIIYDKLFGGFEDLSATAKDDENEIDELDFIPASKKTKNGYLKDGFVVDDDKTSSSSLSSPGHKRKKNKKQPNNSSEEESEFVTETETETETLTESISTDSLREDGSGTDVDTELEQMMTAVKTGCKFADVKNEKIKTKKTKQETTKGKLKNENAKVESEDELEEDEYE
jgi:hypothetical protein